MAKGQRLDISPRQLFIMLESLGLAMDTLKAGVPYARMTREEYEPIKEAHDLFLELEEQWDALSDRERKAATKKPFDVRR